MIRTVIRRTVPLLLALILAAGLPLGASAAEDNFDLSKPCSLTVTLKDMLMEEYISGATVDLYQVGAAQVESSALGYGLTEEFAASGVSLADVKAPGLAAQLAAYAADKSIAPKTGTAGEDGVISFTGLKAGLYLVCQQEAMEDFLPVSPFLISLPMYDSAEGWIYSVQAAPKVDRPSQDPVVLTVVKKWEDNTSLLRPQSISVGLYRDGELYETVTLSAGNKWRHTWDDLNYYFSWDAKELEVPEDYTVRYEQKGSTLTIYNRSDDYKAPDDEWMQTGQLNWPVPVLVSAGLLLVLAGVICLNRGKKNHA